MDPKQTSGEGSVAEEATLPHERENADGAAPGAGADSSRAQAPRVSADAFLALLARLDGKSKEGEAGATGPARTDAGAEEAAAPSATAGASVQPHDAHAPAALQTAAGSVDNGGNAGNADPASASIAEIPSPFGVSDLGASQASACTNTDAEASQGGMAEELDPAPQAAIAEPSPDTSAAEIGGGVSELDVAFASAMVQETGQTPAYPTGEVPPAQTTAPSPGMDPAFMSPQPATPGPMATPAVDAGMAMPGLNGGLEQTAAMPEPPGLQPAQTMPGAMPPPPPLVDGMAAPAGHAPSSTAPAPMPAEGTAPTEHAEEESADVLAERLLAIMAMPDSHAQPSERALATDGLILKLPELSSEARRLVAERFCLMERPSEALTSAVLSLVSGELRHEVLENARFSTWRLLKLVEALDDAERRVIARRRHLPTVVSEALIETGDAACLLELVRNEYARIDEHGFHALVDLAAQQPELQAPLATRGDLPPAVGFRLFRHVPPRLRRHLVSRFLSDSQLLDRVFSIVLQDPPPATAEQVSRIESMIDSIAAGEIETAAGLLSRLLDLHDEAAGWIVADRWGEPLVVVLKVLGYARTTFPQAMGRIINSPASPVEAGRELAELQALFDSLSFNKARLLLLYWDWEARRMGPYALLAEAEDGPAPAAADEAGAVAVEAPAQEEESPAEALQGSGDDKAGESDAAVADAPAAAATQGESEKADAAETAESPADPEAGASDSDDDLTGGQAEVAASVDEVHETAGEAGQTDGMSEEGRPETDETAAHEGTQADTAHETTDVESQDTPASPCMPDAVPQVSGMTNGMSDMQTPMSGMEAPCAPAQASGQAPCPPAAAPCAPGQAPCTPGVAVASASEAAPLGAPMADGASPDAPLQAQTPPPQQAPAMAEGQGIAAQSGNVFGQAMPQSGGISQPAAPIPEPVGITQPAAAMPEPMAPQPADMPQPTAFGQGQVDASPPAAGTMPQAPQPMAQPGMEAPGQPMMPPNAATAGVPGTMAAAERPMQAGAAPQAAGMPGAMPSSMPAQAPAGMNGPMAGMPDASMANAMGQPAGMPPAAPGMPPMPGTPEQDGALPEGGPVTFGKRKVT